MPKRRGHAVNEGLEGRSERPARWHGQPRPPKNRSLPPYGPLLHRPPRLRDGPLDRDPDRRGRGARGDADRAIPRDRAPHGGDPDGLPRRERAGGRRHGHDADRAGGQRRRGDALPVVEEHQRRAGGDRRHLRARHRHRPGPGAHAEPRRRGAREAARGGEAAGGGHEEEVAEHFALREPRVSRRSPRPPLPQQLRAYPGEGRARADRGGGRRRLPGRA